MKRIGNLIEAISSHENMRIAFWRAKKGKSHRLDVQAFASNLDGNLNRLGASLRVGDLNVGKYEQFKIFDPKERLITAPCFEERVLHHAIINICGPIIDRWMIFDTYACRQGKGREAAVKRAQEFSKQNPWFLKLDIRKYFDSIAQDVLLGKLSRLFKDPILHNCFGVIVKTYSSTPGMQIGIPIGSLTSQYFANFYLGWLDRFVKESLRVKAYVRYMDDMILWGESHAQLVQWLNEIRNYLANDLQLELRATPFVNKSTKGVDFLGARIFKSHVTLNRSSRVRLRNGILMLEKVAATGEINENELQQRSTAMIAFATSGRTKSWRYRSNLISS